MLRIGTALSWRERHDPKPAPLAFVSAQCPPLLSATTRGPGRKGGDSPIIDYVDDWPGWKMRIDRFAFGDTPKRAAAVLHSAGLLLSTFITHRRRLLIQYCGVAG